MPQLALAVAVLCYAFRTVPGSFGGIIENSNAPEGWWGAAHYDVLTEQEAQRDATFLN